MMIDTHCHIDQYENPMEVVNECEAAGIITIGVTNLPSHFEMGYKHIEHCKKVRLALGMHPLYAQFHEQEFSSFVKNLSKTSYVGEVGLDFSKEGLSTKEIQVESFKNILSAIKGQKKILSLHSRNAENEVLKFLKEYNVQTAIFHWYSGPVSLIEDIAALGYFFSVNPAMIKSKLGMKIIERIPQNNLLTESDGPFISIEGRVIRPSDVQTVHQYLSKTLNLSVHEIEAQIQRNFFSLVASLKEAR